MSDTTAIGWTDATWNPWYGCTKVSEGCDHCYMFRDMKRYGRDPETVTRSKTKFGDPLKWKDGRLIFTCSWSDWFHKDADPWRDEAWAIIKQTPRHTYQILTKRPGRIARHLPADWGDGYPNVWLGTSVESQEYVNRIESLVSVPARIHFLSCEPLLGELDVTDALHGYPRQTSSRQVVTRDMARDAGDMALEGSTYSDDKWEQTAPAIDWVIAGGESGADQRECNPDWLRSLRDQCSRASVPFFLKQLGGHPDARAHDKAILDGRTWTDFPKAAQP